MNTQPVNRRRFNRIQFTGQVNLEFINDQYPNCQVRNLSLSGIYIAGNFQEQLSDKCQINFVHTAIPHENDFQAQARFVRKDEEGVALEFTEMSFDSYAFLMATLIYGSEDPLIIQEEMPMECPFNVIEYK